MDVASSASLGGVLDIAVATRHRNDVVAAAVEPGEKQ
jgi:hypothetical protein